MKKEVVPITTGVLAALALAACQDRGQAFPDVSAPSPTQSPTTTPSPETRQKLQPIPKTTGDRRTSSTPTLQEARVILQQSPDWTILDGQIDLRTSPVLTSVITVEAEGASRVFTDTLPSFLVVEGAQPPEGVSKEQLITFAKKREGGAWFAAGDSGQTLQGRNATELWRFVAQGSTMSPTDLKTTLAIIKAIDRQINLFWELKDDQGQATKYRATAAKYLSPEEYPEVLMTDVDGLFPNQALSDNPDTIYVRSCLSLGPNDPNYQDPKEPTLQVIRQENPQFSDEEVEVEYERLINQRKFWSTPANEPDPYSQYRQAVKEAQKRLSGNIKNGIGGAVVFQFRRIVPIGELYPGLDTPLYHRLREDRPAD